MYFTYFYIVYGSIHVYNYAADGSSITRIYFRKIPVIRTKQILIPLQISSANKQTATQRYPRVGQKTKITERNSTNDQ